MDLVVVIRLHLFSPGCSTLYGYCCKFGSFWCPFLRTPVFGVHIGALTFGTPLMGLGMGSCTSHRPEQAVSQRLRPGDSPRAGHGSVNTTQEWSSQGTGSRSMRPRPAIHTGLGPVAFLRFCPKVLCAGSLWSAQTLLPEIPFMDWIGLDCFILLKGNASEHTPEPWAQPRSR